MQKSTKNVLFLAFNFPPMGGAGVHRSLKFVKYLPEFGWTPTILTVDLGFFKNGVRDHTLLREIPPGLEIIRVKFPNSLHKVLMEKPGIIYSILRSFFLIWPDIFRPWINRAVATGMKKAETKPFHLIYSTMLPISTGVAGVRLSKKLRLPLVIDFRDPITTTHFYDYPTKIHWHVAKHYERMIIENSSKTIMNTPVARDEMQTRYCLHKKDILCIPNGYDEKDFNNARAKKSNDKFRFVYCGSYLIGVSTSISNESNFRGRLKALVKSIQYTERPMDRTTMAPSYLFDAISIIGEKSPDILDKMEVLFIGGRKKLIEETACKRNLQGIVKSLGYLTHREALSYMLGADALVLTLYRPLSRHALNSVPGKTYEYIRSCRPILALVPPGDTHEIVEKSKLGIFASQTDALNIAQSIQKLVSKRSSNVSPDKDYIGSFERKKLTGKLADIFNQVSDGL